MMIMMTTLSKRKMPELRFYSGDAEN